MAGGGGGVYVCGSARAPGDEQQQQQPETVSTRDGVKVRKCSVWGLFFEDKG